MKLLKTILFVAFAVFLSGPLCFAKPSQKPLSPLQVRIIPVQPGITPGQIKPGDTVEFKITAVSSIDLQEMHINVELLGGVKIVSGDTSWTGPAAKNEEKSIKLTARAPKKGQGRIKARVSAPPSNSTRFSAIAQYLLGPEVKSRPEQEHPVKKDSKGREILEYRVR